MPTIQKMNHCNACDRQTVHLQQTPNHILHLLLTLLTCGLWIFVWISVGKSSAQCTSCGDKHSTFNDISRGASKINLMAYEETFGKKRK